MSLKASKSTPVKKVPVKRKAANGYKLPDPIPIGEVLRDVTKRLWQIGPSIGIGGFGEIYSASDVSETDTSKSKATLPYVIKIEPHGNGPLFVEMHVYMKVAKLDQIEEWKTLKKLKSLGMPRFLGSGSHECNNEKYRFVVMDRFGKDLWSLFLENNREFPLPTVLRVGIQVIDVLEYIHSKGYVHADIKGGNLLLGSQKGTENQVYLVDFGLASHYSKSEYKPDAKKAHNGTIEYTSRDAHMGVPTRRGDLEILGYNLLQWLSSKLPWESNLSDPVQVHQQKKKFMENIPELMKSCFNKIAPPAALLDYFNYVANLSHNEDPDYGYCRKLLEKGLKDCRCSVDGKLDFISIKKVQKSSRKNTSSDTKPVVKKKKSGSARQNRNVSNAESSEDETEVDQKEEKEKLNSGNKKTKTKPTSSWKDCPTAKASNVNKAGEYKRPSDNENTWKVKKQKKVNA